MRGSSGPRKHVAGLPLPIADDWRPRPRLLETNPILHGLSTSEVEEVIVAFRAYAKAEKMLKINFGRSFVDWLAKKTTKEDGT
jgi:hypothetical protein